MPAHEWLETLGRKLTARVPEELRPARRMRHVDRPGSHGGMAKSWSPTIPTSRIAFWPASTCRCMSPPIAIASWWRRWRRDGHTPRRAKSAGGTRTWMACLHVSREDACTSRRARCAARVSPLWQRCRAKVSGAHGGQLSGLYDQDLGKGPHPGLYPRRARQHVAHVHWLQLARLGVSSVAARIGGDGEPAARFSRTWPCNWRT